MRGLFGIWHFLFHPIHSWGGGDERLVSLRSISSRCSLLFPSRICLCMWMHSWEGGWFVLFLFIFFPYSNPMSVHGSCQQGCGGLKNWGTAEEWDLKLFPGHKLPPWFKSGTSRNSRCMITFTICFLEDGKEKKNKKKNKEKERGREKRERGIEIWEEKNVCFRLIRRGRKRAETNP